MIAMHLQATDESYSVLLRDISTRSVIAKVRMLNCYVILAMHEVGDIKLCYRVEYSIMHYRAILCGLLTSRCFILTV